MQKFNQDIAYKLLAPKYYYNVAKEKTPATITFWKASKSRFSTYLCAIFLYKHFNILITKRNIIRLRKRKKYRRIFVVDIRQNNYVLLNLHRLPPPVTIGTAYGHDVLIPFSAFVLRIPIRTDSGTYSYKLAQALVIFQLDLEKNDVLY